MGIIVDLIIILIISACVYGGYRHGLARCLLKFLTSILAIIIALFLYKPFVNFIINNTTIDDHIALSFEKVMNNNSGNNDKIVSDDSGLPKPIEKEKLYNTIDLAIQLMDDRNHVFTFKNKNGSHRVRIKDILYFESSAHNFIIVTVNERYEFRAGLSDIMSELSGYGFIQVHRSYIVNYDRIRTIKYEELIMENGYAIPISRNKRKEIRDILMKFGGSRL